MGFETVSEDNNQNDEVTLESLRNTEEICKQAVKQAQESGATEPVFEDLRGRYFVAKQAREDFEKND